MRKFLTMVAVATAFASPALAKTVRHQTSTDASTMMYAGERAGAPIGPNVYAAGPGPYSEPTTQPVTHPLW